MVGYEFRTDEEETLNDEEIQQSLEEVAKEFGIVIK